MREREGRKRKKRQPAKAETREKEITIEWKRTRKIKIKKKIFKEETNRVKPCSRESVQILLLGGQSKEYKKTKQIQTNKKKNK